jgi:serine/threonine protein kinase
MYWPLASHFQASLQNPKFAFRDPQLQSCSFAKDALGQPRAWSGSFAVVYKMIDPKGNPRALRVFSTASPQKREHYDCIAEYLRTRKVDALIGFEYRNEEIRSSGDGKRYPVVLMDWVEGETLFQWVRSHCRANERTRLDEAARYWLALTQELSETQIAHGDLQHANVLVTPTGQFKLVDYDGMCVPALVGQRNFETGTPPYQHPGRNGDTLLSVRLDDFSTLLVYVVLRALAAEPPLWSRYVEQVGYDKLLFRQDDFRDPDKSALRRDLQRSPDPQVHELAECLFASAAGAMDRVPRLNELAVAPRRTLAAPPRPTAIATPPPARNPVPKAPGRPVAKPKRKQRPGDASGKGIVSARTQVVSDIDGYEIGQQLGTGPLGIVYEANRKSDQRVVAIKFVSLNATVAEHRRRRLLREMDRIRRLQHPNIAALLACGMVGDQLYFVAERCAGESLAESIRLRGKLPLIHARPLLMQSLDALKHAHLHHVIHGGLKPENLLWSCPAELPVAKITDFALARNLNAAEFSCVAAAGRQRIDNRFTPRERLTSEHEWRPVSDLWSLAAVFYYAISNHFPYDFSSKDPAEVVLRSDPVPLRQRDPSTPASIADALDRALRTSTTQRYQTAAEMKAGLEEAFSAAARSSRSA